MLALDPRGSLHCSVRGTDCSQIPPVGFIAYGIYYLFLYHSCLQCHEYTYRGLVLLHPGDRNGSE